jgi:hypothetical protein
MADRVLVSDRRTVVSETEHTIPRATASRASSAAHQRDSCRPVSAGSSHASALTSAISPGDMPISWGC